MKVSLVIPVFNEAEHLEKFLKTIDELQLPVEKELVIIDDGSKDSSAHIIKSYPFKSPVRQIFQSLNHGKGTAIALGIEQATGDIIGIQDADFEYDPSDIPNLLEPLLNNRADVVYGSRFKGSSHQVHRTLHYLVNRLLTLVSNALSGLYLTDMETCYKFFRADVIQYIRLQSKRFGFEPEVTAKIGRLKLRVMELPISYFPRNYIEGKKITWKDGVAALLHTFYFNLIISFRQCFFDGLPDKYIPRHSNWL
jgi:glycosyltransferase involved in cell wall biosynthesis